MDSPAADLHDDVALIDAALEPFTAPEVNERSGLRWLQRTLTERRAHITAKIDEAERSTVTVRVCAASGSPWVPLPVVTALLAALHEALQTAATEIDWPDALDDPQRRAAVTLEPGDADAGDDWWRIELHRPAGPLNAQPVTADGDRLAVDAALTAMADAVEADPGQVGRIVVASGLTVELRISPVSGDTRTLTLDRHTATA